MRQSDFSDILAGLVDNPASCLRHAGLGEGASCTQTQWEAYRAFVSMRLPAILYQPMWVTSANGEVRFHTEALAHTSLTSGFLPKPGATASIASPPAPMQPRACWYARSTSPPL